MTIDAKEQIKNTGATFTPRDLAEYLARSISKYSTIKDPKILDPACGDGELLLAMAKEIKNPDSNFTLTGFDSNDTYLKSAKTRINHKNLTLSHSDFLDIDLLKTNPDELLNHQKEARTNFDIVIANPPYVRTQLLGADYAQQLAKKYDLKGRVDLYYPFLIEMTRSLSNGGILGVITSNRYLSTKSGESIREYLMDNFEILEVIDLGDTKLFDAAVLPAIFIGKKKDNLALKQKKTEVTTSTFLKIYEDLEFDDTDVRNADSIFAALNSNSDGVFNVLGRRYKKSSGALICNTGKGKDWVLLDTEESKWIKNIDASSKNRVGDIFKVRVGIKTTADKVFIRKTWDSPDFDMPEKTLIRELISQENIQRWNVDYSKNLQIIYPHHSISGKKHTVNIDEYPKAKKYFEIHQDKLKSRKYVIDAGRKWYEIWVPHHPDFWSKPKLVFPDISNTPRFYFDAGGKLVNGNCYWIMAENDDEVKLLHLIQGVANSQLMTKYHDLVFNNKLYSGRRRYFTQFVERYPLPDPNSKHSKSIIEIVQKLNVSKSDTEINLLENQLELTVCKAFGV